MKVILYMAITANGMIARTDDSTHWSEEELAAYLDKVKECGNMVIGRRTYEIMQTDTDPDADPEAQGNPQVVVITNNNDYQDKDKVKFVKSPQEALNFLKGKGFETAMVAGGSSIDMVFIKEQLVDEIYLDVEPYVFGQGVPLFRPEDFEYKLELLEVNKLSSQTIQLHYKVLK